MISYLSFCFCNAIAHKAIAVTILVAWLAYLFACLGIVAGDFLAVNLSCVAHELHVSDSLAGVTFLAFGNAAPDIFSTLAAMNSNAKNLAFGEVLGAAAFITAVVAGSMALMGPFRVPEFSLVRDAVFLLVAVGFLVYIMAEGKLKLWHCITMLLIYAVYIFIVAGWHYWLHRQNRTFSSKDDRRADSESRSFQASDQEEEPLLPQHNAPNKQLAVRNQSQNKQSVNTNVPVEEPESESGIFHHNESTGGYQVIPRRRSSVTIVAETLTVVRPREKRRGKLHTLVIIVMAPAICCLRLTVPVAKDLSNEKDDIDDQSDDDDEGWPRWLFIIQCFTAPQLLLAFINNQVTLTESQIWKSSLILLGTSIIVSIFAFMTSNSTELPRWYPFLSAIGFVVSIVWISTIADEIVGVLKALGVVFNLSGAILGMTVFAVGNSLDDMMANISVARLEHPVMALGACFGGPLLTILFGVSVSGIISIVRGWETDTHPGTIDINAPRDLYVAAGMTMVAILCQVVLMPLTGWRMTKVVGFVLIGIWVIGTAINVILEIKS